VAARVLIAEDDGHIVESLSFILGRDGFEVESVADGEAALVRLAGPQRPDLLILDVMLPRRNGFEILKAIRADTRLQALPVLMLTAKAQPHDRAAAQALGADVYVTKPFANSEVLAQARRLTLR